jgi:hypothetical protein
MAVFLGLLALGGSAEAQETSDILAPRNATHLALGPQVSAIQYASEWDTEVGAELHLARLRKSRALSVIGGSLGVASFGEGEQVQLTLDFYAGTQALTQLPIGVSFGPLLEVFPHGRPQVGGRVTVWAYYGVMPYAGVAWLDGPNAPDSPSVEIGLKIPFSVWDW